MNIKYNGVIDLGFATSVGGTIVFPADNWISTYGNSGYTLKHERPDGTILTHNLQVDITKNILIWDITEEDRIYCGDGSAQIIYESTNKIAKSQILKTKIKEWR